MLQGRQIKGERLTLLVVGAALAIFTVIVLGKGLTWAFSHWWQITILTIVGALVFGLYSGRIRMPQQVNVGLPALAPGQQGSHGHGMSRRAARPGVLSTIGGWILWLLNPVRWAWKKLKLIILIVLLLASFISGVIVTASADSVLTGFLSKIPGVGTLVGLGGSGLTPGQAISVDGEFYPYVGPLPEGVDANEADFVVVKTGGIIGIGSKPIVLVKPKANGEPVTSGDASGKSGDVVVVTKPEDGGVRGWLGRAGRNIWDWAQSKW